MGSIEFLDLKNDALIMKKADEQLKLPDAIFSESDDDDCIVKDDNEEGISSNSNLR